MRQPLIRLVATAVLVCGFSVQPRAQPGTVPGVPESAPPTVAPDSHVGHRSSSGTWDIAVRPARATPQVDGARVRCVIGEHPTLPTCPDSQGLHNLLRWDLPKLFGLAFGLTVIWLIRSFLLFVRGR